MEHFGSTHLGSIFALLLLSSSAAMALMQPHQPHELLKELVRLNDDDILPGLLRRQNTDQTSKVYGAYVDADTISSVGGTASLIQALMCSYVSPDSKHYQSKEILASMTIAANALISLQHEDGTIDLVNANFHSTPDVGFTIYPLSLAYSIMLQKNTLDYGELPALMTRYMLKAGDALSVGGVHTPNHRWVISGALSWLYRFFQDPKYKARAEQWLAEGIDIDPDGQYNERSTAVYTPITNRSLITMARNMGVNDLYDDVRKNLDMTFYLVRPNGEIVTESSHRGDGASNMSGYYLAYRTMALLDKNSRYAGMARTIESAVPLRDLGDMLAYFLEDPSLLQDLPEPTPPPTSYRMHFEYSDMVRIREGDVDVSIMANNTTFFNFFKGNAALGAMRLSAAFFGRGQFTSEKIEQADESYVLSSTIKRGYYQPLPPERIPSDGETWGKVPREERELSEVQTLDTRISLAERDGKVEVKVSIQGPENLPVSLELGFRQGGTLTNVDAKEGTDNAYLIKNGEYAEYSKEGNTIKVGPGVCKHKTTQLRGALPKLQADCLYFTSYAPCEIEFSIE